MISGMQAAGMDAASLANLREALGNSQPGHGSDEFDGLWREHVPVVDAFLAVSSQWRTASAGAGGMITPAGGVIAPNALVFIGLDYAAVRVGLDAEGIVVTPELWRDLRTIEAAAASALNEDD